MSQQVTQEAFFDSLSLAHKLDNFLDGFKLEEVHLFSYFSAFLYCYSGNSFATWPHKYTAENGYPFSTDLDGAIQRHIHNGLFENKGEYFTITGRGTDEFNRFKLLPTLANREKMLNAACTTTILIPYSQTLRALLNEPDLKKQSELKTEWLNPTSFYSQSKEITDALGIHSADLMIPAVALINLLTEQAKTEN